MLLEQRCDQRPIDVLERSRGPVAFACGPAHVGALTTVEWAAAAGVGMVACVLSCDLTGLVLVLVRW
jgi:hypothetical protein